MSGKFNGFTQEDINRVKSVPQNSNTNMSNNHQNPSQHFVNNAKNPLPAKATVNRNKTFPKPIIKTTTNSNAKTAATPAAINPTAIEAPVLNDVDNSYDDSDTSKNNSVQEAMTFKPLHQMKNQAEPINMESNFEEENGNNEEPTASGTHHQLSPFQGMSLKDYGAQCRMIEEQNRNKKEMLYKAIEQYSERTAAEAKKLNEIKLELTKLESELANDVQILRKKIDDASVRYMQAQKHFQQIETTFLNAKSGLHQAREKKDLLVDHLNIIISNNEERKAEKLSELMEKVGIATDEDQ